MKQYDIHVTCPPCKGDIRALKQRSSAQSILQWIVSQYYCRPRDPFSLQRSAVRCTQLKCSSIDAQRHFTTNIHTGCFPAASRPTATAAIPIAYVCLSVCLSCCTDKLLAGRRLHHMQAEETDYTAARRHLLTLFLTLQWQRVQTGHRDDLAS